MENKEDRSLKDQVLRDHRQQKMIDDLRKQALIDDLYKEVNNLREALAKSRELMSELKKDGDDNPITEGWDDLELAVWRTADQDEDVFDAVAASFADFQEVVGVYVKEK